MSDPPPEVRAAGGVIWRREPDGGRRWAVIHRPRYDDWSLPKGKLEPGESLEAAAEREVLEETGLRCRLGAHVGTTGYLDQRGRNKTVHYWLMESDGGGTGFTPNHEVDDLRWLDTDAALALLSHERDRDLLRTAAVFRES